MVGESSCWVIVVLLHAAERLPWMHFSLFVGPVTPIFFSIAIVDSFSLQQNEPTPPVVAGTLVTQRKLLSRVGPSVLPSPPGKFSWGGYG